MADENPHSSHATARLIASPPLSRTRFHFPYEQFMSPLARLFNSPRLLLTLVSLFWAGNIVLGRFIAGQVPPVMINWVRWTGAFLLLLGFAWPYARRDWPAIKASWKILTLVTLLGIAVYNTISYYALQYTQAINALLILSTGPLVIAVVTFLLYGEKPSRREVLGVFASLIGVIIVIAHGDLEVLKSLKLNAGDVWFFIALVIYAIYTALLRVRPKIHPFSFALVTFGWGAAMLTPFLIYDIAAGQHVVWNRTTLLTLGYIVTFPSLFAYLFYNRGVELIGPNRAAPFYHLMPLFGSVLAIVFLGERPELYHAVGYALVLSGIAVATANVKRAPKTSAASPAAPAAAPAPSPAPPAARRRRPRSKR
jgi:drug/metabolite transporter (DMT)-like permease